MELLKLYHALMRRKWIVVQAVLFFVVGAAVCSVLLPKNYVASSRVLVSSSDTTLSILSDLGLSEVAAGLSSESDDVTNKIQLAITRPVMEEIIWRLQLRDDDGRLFVHEEVLVPGLFGELEARPHLAVIQQQGTDILAFDGRANDPELARLMADTHVRVAIQRSQERARADTTSARMFIEEQLQVVRDEFDVAMQTIADAKAEEEILDLESEVKAAVARTSELMLAFEQNAVAIQDTRGQLAELRAYQGRESISAVSPATQVSNLRVQELRDRLTTLRQERASELTLKTERHPDIEQIDVLMVSANEELAEALAEQHALSPAAHELEATLAGEIKRGREIQAAIARTTEQFAVYPEKLRRLSQLQLAASAAETVFQSLQEQRYQIGVAEAMLVSDLMLIEPARTPEKHHSPKLVVNLILGLLLGGLVGLGLALLFEYVDDSIITFEDMGTDWSISRLGVIPRFKTDVDERLIANLNLTHPIAESYRTVRNGLLYASLDKPIRVIGVTSAMPGEGKSTFSINLAISFAREGKRVLVVDCDLRKPKQHRHFPSTSNHTGLTDLLAQSKPASEAIQSTPVEGVDLLCSGPVPNDPGKLVESLRLRQVLLDASKHYDIVVVDTPPTMVVNDALVIARVVDGMVLVIESQSTTRKVLLDTRSRMASFGVEPIGVVLNKLNFKASGYGNYIKAYDRYLVSEKVSEDESPVSTEGGAA